MPSSATVLSVHYLYHNWAHRPCAHCSILHTASIVKLEVCSHCVYTLLQLSVRVARTLTSGPMHLAVKNRRTNPALPDDTRIFIFIFT